MAESEIECVECVEMEGKYLKSLGSVKVYPPTNRKKLHCLIHGEISFNDDPAKAPVTLFRREEPDLVILGHEDYGFLSLSDDPSDRPLVGLDNPIYVNMKLYERKPLEDGGGDELIANVNNFKFGQEPDSDSDRCQWVKVPGEFGFVFEVAYAVVLGARVQVEVRIVEDEDNKEQLIPKKRDSDDRVIPIKLPIWGTVTALQEFDCPRCSCGRATITLWERDDELQYVEVGGSPVALDRKVVVAPVNLGLYLSIGLHLFCGAGSETPIVNQWIDFPVELVNIDWCSFTINKNLTLTKQVRVTDAVFSVSIKFLPHV